MNDKYKEAVTFYDMLPKDKYKELKERYSSSMETKENLEKLLKMAKRLQNEHVSKYKEEDLYIKSLSMVMLVLNKKTLNPVQKILFYQSILKLIDDFIEDEEIGSSGSTCSNYDFSHKFEM